MNFASIVGFRMRFLRAVIPVLLLASASLAAPPGARIDATVTADVSAVKPGDSFTLAVTLKTQPEWHIYWINPGDAGTATRFKLELPENFRAQPAQFPLPTQFVQPGNLTVYGYTGEATFLIPVTTSKDVPIGQPAQITVNAFWLSCNKDQCVPGKQKLTLSLPVAGETAANTSAQSQFSSARKDVPADALPDGVTVAPQPPATLSNIATPLLLNLTWKTPVKNVEAFPFPVEGLDLGKPSVTHNMTATTITATARVLAGQTLGANQQSFLITYTDADGTRRGFVTAVALPAPASSK